jgi:Fe-S-cluster containining protein
MGCKRCGQCCKLIGWCFPDCTPEETWAKTVELAKKHGFSPDAELIVAHWHYCYGTEKWWCDLLDFETNLCTKHGEKKHVCAGYPWYGQPRADLPNVLHEGCGFEPERQRAIRRRERRVTLQPVQA